MAIRNATLSRRNALGLASSTIVAGLAGCLTENSSQQNSDENKSEDDHQSEDNDNQSSEGESHDDDHGSHSEENQGGHDEKLNGPSEHAEVLMTSTDSGEHFEPHVVWVEQGATVTWQLESGAHLTTAYHSENDKPDRIPEEASAWDSGVLSEQDAPFDHTFETPGVYDYFCTPHEGQGMLGSIIVGQPDPEEQPGLAEPTDELPDTATEKLRELNDRVAQALSE